jgi:transposase-like protein
MNRIEPGETIRYCCSKCDREYEITFEPKAADMQTKPDMDSAAPSQCPFCGSFDFYEC